MATEEKESTKLEIRNKDGIISVYPPLNIPEVKGLGSTFFDKMKGHKNAVAQIDGLTGEKETWDQILQRSIRTAIAMRSKGVTSEDLVSICSLASFDSCIPFIAATFVGAKIANLDPRIPLDDTVYLLKKITPRMVFVSQDAEQLIEDALREADIEADIVVFGESAKHLKFSDCLLPSTEEKTFIPVEVRNIKATAIIIFSSGTAGLPKAICLSHYALLAPKLSTDLWEKFTGKVMLSFASLFWVSATTLLIASVISGVVRLLYPTFDPKTTWRIINDHKPSIFFTTPTNIILSCKNGRPENVDTSSLQLIAVTGAPISRDQMVSLRELFPETLVANFYAASELSGNGLLWDLEADTQLISEKSEAIGRPAQGLHYKVVDPTTEQVLGPYQEGELRIKTDFDMNGYYKQDSSDAWDADGFIKSGDIVYYDGEYRFFLVDRIKEMMKFQGWLVVPAKLEEVLLSHPAVKAAVVFGIHHPEDGDHPIALVEVKESFKNSTTGSELEKYVEERVHETQKIRAGVKIVKNIPTNPNGKYNRKRLRELVLRNEI